MGRLPYRPEPLPDELFSSWLCRLALANVLEPTYFTRLELPSMNLLQQDFDLFCDDKYLNILSAKTDIAKAALSKTLLSSLIGNYLTDIYLTGQNREILACKVRGGYRQRSGQQFCPLCLKEDKNPYYRKHWRLTAMTVCAKHRRILQVQCPFCGSTVNYQRVTCLHDNLAQCYKCGRSLISNIYADVDPPDCLVRFQAKLEQAIIDGWYCLSHDTIIRTPLLIEGLRFLSKPWLSVKTSEKMYECFSEYTQIALPPILYKVKKSRRIFSFSSCERSRLYTVLGWLLESWPNNLLSFCSHYKMRPTDFFKTDAKPPYWLHSVFLDTITSTNYWRDTAEFISAGLYLCKQGYATTAPNIAEALGLDRSVHITNERKAIIQRLQKIQQNKEKAYKKVFYYD